MIPMSSITSLKSINTLHILFTHYGIPKGVVSDNRLQLATEEFIQFMRQQEGVKFTRVPPYKNGAAECSVEKAKLALTEINKFSIAKQVNLL